MEELIQWLSANKIVFHPIDKEVVEIDDFGKMFLADLGKANSIFRTVKDKLEFNLMESPDVLMAENIYYVAFPFGKNWYYYDLREEFRFNILKYIGKRETPAMNIPFVNLGVHTPFELLNGSGDIGLWVRKAKMMGQTAIGICDRNTMAGTLMLQKECAKQGIRHVIGYSFTLAHEGEKVEMKVYCQTKKGLQNLLRIQKAINVDYCEDNEDSGDNGGKAIAVGELMNRGSGNVLVMGKLSSYWMAKYPNVVEELIKAFDRVYYQFDPTEYKAERIDREVLEALGFFFEKFYHRENGFMVEPVLICDNYYLDKDDAKNKLTLNKIATGAAHRQSDEQYFKDADELYAMFQTLFSDSWNVEELFRDMCRHTVEMAENATASFELGKMYMPKYIMRQDERNTYKDRRDMFRNLLDNALKEKIPKEKQRQYWKRLDEEMYIIESTDNVDYFLIQYDMIREARKRGITVGVGRGSAGGSLVSYLLGIITIDPIEYDLLFSRFLVPERCGLKWVDEITIVGQDIDQYKGNKYYEVVSEDGQRFFFYRVAEFRIKRGETEMNACVDELQAGDEIMFDNRDLLWTLNEIKQ